MGPSGSTGADLAIRSDRFTRECRSLINAAGPATLLPKAERSKIAAIMPTTARRGRRSRAASRSPPFLSSCSLLKEAEPLSMDSNRDISEISTNKGSTGFPGSSGVSGGGSGSGSGGQFDSATLEERQLLGRYGVWLLVGLCTPNQDTSIEILGRLLSMLFHWFHVTAYSFDGTKKSLMHLIFSVGNLTLRILYT